MPDSPLKALQRAVNIAKGQTALGRLIGKSQQHVWNCLNVSERASAEDVIPIETATGVSRNALRPDLYPMD